MRKGLLAGLTGVACVAAISCGEEEVENPKITVPDAVNSADTALAMRVTGPYGPNDDQVVSALSRILNSKVSFSDLATRGGLPSGAVEANIAGSAAAQLKAVVDNGGLFAPADAVDACGNPMLTAFLTPDMLDDVFTDSSPAEITGLGSWPGVCADDLSCDTSKTGAWEVAFSAAHGDNSRDLIVRLNAMPGPTTQPGFQGHLISSMLTTNNTGNHLLTTAVYGNIRALTINAFGLVKFAKAGVSLRPGLPLPGMPTMTYAFPAEARALGGADLIVGVEADSFCERDWAINFGSAAPFGCDSLKPLVLDLSAPTNLGLYQTRTDSGEDEAGNSELGGDLDDIVAAFNYQLKAQVVCPDVSEPSWVRQDIPLGSVEVFQCPDGDIDNCIAYHDMEDYWCELGPPTPDTLGIEVEAQQPLWEGGSAAYAGPFTAHTQQSPQTIKYTIDGTEYEITWTQAYNLQDPMPVATVVAHLNAREQFRADGGPQQIKFSLNEDSDGIVAEAAIDFGPEVGFVWAAGTLNNKLGLSGASTQKAAALPAVGGDHYTITAVNTTTDVAYVSVTGSAATPAVIYADEPDRVLGVFDADGVELEINPRADSHCSAKGLVAWDITQPAFLLLDLATDGEDQIRLVSSNMAVNQ